MKSDADIIDELQEHIGVVEAERNELAQALIIACHVIEDEGIAGECERLIELANKYKETAND